MKTVNIEIHEVTPNGIRLEWDSGYAIIASTSRDGVHIRANSSGLRSLARHLLTLADDGVAVGRHIHFDDSNCLEDGSIPIAFEKLA